MSAFSNPDTDITPEQARRLIDESGAQLIDVREDYEWEAGHIEAARHIELERLASRASTIDKDRPVVFQCRSGSRSAMATQAFRAAGYDAFNMEGGITRWAGEGLPIEPADGHVADH
jgi:rhodanese-related sulfurtransferase